MIYKKVQGTINLFAAVHPAGLSTMVLFISRTGFTLGVLLLENGLLVIERRMKAKASRFSQPIDILLCVIHTIDCTTTLNIYLVPHTIIPATRLISAHH